MSYETMIGLEIHVELKTRTKMFCRCSAAFGREPNTSICPVCTGQPGALPSVNREAVLMGMVLALELHGNILPVSRFDRKNYFYPDNPKSYQITQHFRPLSTGGWLDIGGKHVRIHELHLEEDAGKLLHTPDGRTLVNLNRAGVPLAEIVTEPDFSSPEEVITFLTRLRDIVIYSGVSDGRMQEGSLRVDVNLSLKERSGSLGTRTEMKNLNSFTEIRHAIQHEATRQAKLLDSGMAVVQETRRWDESAGKSFSMRGKENASDYRYFPEPDLYPLRITEELLQEAARRRREMRPEKKERFMSQFGLTDYAAGVVTEDPETASLFEKTAVLSGDPKAVSSLIGTEVLRLIRETGVPLSSSHLTPEIFSEILVLQKNGKITGTVLKELLAAAYRAPLEVSSYVREKGLLTVADPEALLSWVDEVIRENPGPVEQFLSGKEKVLMFLVGQVMKKAGGRADAETLKKMLPERLKKDRN